ncbi:MAG: hypothetical protein RJB05_522 [Armatimonadota bacterium]|jgi:transcriptional regulator with XRE-family HTH domain
MLGDKRPETGNAGVGPDPITLGARIQRIRLRMNLSVRDVAEKAGVNKNTILRLEKGLTPSYTTLNRVCEALGIHIAQLTRQDAHDETTIAIHSRMNEGRSQLAADETALLTSLECRLPDGKINSALLELYDRTEPVNHPGEEFIFCLRGTALLTVGGQTYTLGEGDAATFWSTEIHRYAPAEETPEESLPVLLLTVWLDTRDER